MIYCNEIYDNTDDDFPLKNINYLKEYNIEKTIYYK